MSTVTVTQTFDQFIREQLAIYAKELWEHFNEERRLRRQLEDRARAEAIQEERERIGKELHDSVIQSIYAVGLDLEGCCQESQHGHLQHQGLHHGPAARPPRGEGLA